MTLRRLLSSYLLGTLLLTLVGGSGGVYFLVSSYLHRSMEVALRSQLGLPRHGGARLLLPLPPARQFATPQFSVRIYDDRGRLIDEGGGPRHDRPLPVVDHLSELTASGGNSLIVPSHNRREGWMMLLVAVRDSQQNFGGAVEIGTGTRQARDLLGALAGYLSLCIVLGLTLGVVAVGGLTRSVGQPVEQLAAVSRSIAAGDWEACANPHIGPLEVRTLAGDFNAMVGQLKVSLETQRRFVADASHELKTPLTSIGAMAEILETQEVDEERRRKALQVIVREVDRMGQLVNDLLTLSQLEHAQQPPPPVDPAACSSQLVEDYRLQRPTLQWCLHSSCRVRLEVSRWQRLLRNLLDNALQHTPPDKPIQVHLKAEAGRLLLEVVDHGVGIEAEALPHLFERFYRADSSRSRLSGGTGLGLAICHSIVSAAHGEIHIESQPGLGTTVRVSIAEAGP